MRLLPLLFMNMVVLTLMTYAKEICKGFYVTNSNDTVHCSFVIPLHSEKPDFISLQWKVQPYDSADKKDKLRPRDIKGYSFTFNDTVFTFHAKKNTLGMTEFMTYRDDDFIFLWIKVDGPLKMYKYYDLLAIGPTTPPIPIRIPRYCLQWKDAALFTPRKFKKDMMWYLAAYEELTKKIESEVYTENDIETIVKEYNAFVSSK